MSERSLHRAAALTARTRHVFVATADVDGRPHVAAASTLTVEAPDLVAVTAWFCPGTMANLERNRRVSLVAWDPTSDDGVQIVGVVETVRELAVLDGVPPPDAPQDVPQIDWLLRVRVEKTLGFTARPHSDHEL